MLNQYPCGKLSFVWGTSQEDARKLGEVVDGASKINHKCTRCVRRPPPPAS